MSGTKDVSSNSARVDNLQTMNADEASREENKERMSTLAENVHRRFSLARTGLKSLAAITTLYAIAWLTWPLWAGYTPNPVQEFLNPVLGLGRAEPLSQQVDLNGGQIDILERKVARIQSQLSGLKKSPQISQFKDKVDGVILDLRGHREEHANLGDIMTAKSLVSRLEVVENEIKNLVGNIEMRDGPRRLEDRLAAVENEIRKITDLGTNSEKELTEGGSNALKARAEMQIKAVLEEKIKEFDKDVSLLTSRILELEKQKAEYSESLSVNRAEGLLMFAIGKLKSVALAGEKFAREWENTLFLASENPLVREGLVSIKPFAESGVASIRFLQAELTLLADRATKISPPRDNPRWINQILERISSLITVRRIGPNAAAGKDHIALMARAEISLSEGDLRGAIKAISDLTGKQSELFEPWLAKARIRYQVENTLDKAISVLFAKQKLPENK